MFFHFRFPFPVLLDIPFTIYSPCNCFFLFFLSNPLTRAHEKRRMIKDEKREHTKIFESFEIKSENREYTFLSLLLIFFYLCSRQTNITKFYKQMSIVSCFVFPFLKNLKSTTPLFYSLQHLNRRTNKNRELFVGHFRIITAAI